MDSYYLYASGDNAKLPSGRYGAAAMKMIEGNKFPLWALFAYKDLANAANGPAPDPLALVHEDAIILGPTFEGSTIQGMLICKEAASNKRLYMENESGIRWLVDMPNIQSKFFACESSELTYTRL